MTARSVGSAIDEGPSRIEMSAFLPLSGETGRSVDIAKTTQMTLAA